MKKKILIISASAGTGHLRAAEALRQTVETDYPEWEALHIDLLKYSDWLIKKTMSSGYNFIVKHLPRIYGLIYRTADFSKNSSEILESFIELFRIDIRRFHQFIEEYKPDSIVCTFFLAVPLLKKYAGKIPVDFVMTDYDINNICLSPFIRFFFTPAEEFAARLIKNNRQAFAFGIPIDQEFLKDKNVEEIKKSWAMNPNFPTILVAGGGVGLADSTLIVKNILKSSNNLNLIVVTGKDNQKVKNKMESLDKKDGINLQTIEYTDKFDELMRTADIIITKPGGLTVTETLFLKKPLIFYSPIPGQEEANAAYLTKNNLGIFLDDPEDGSAMIKQILNKEKTFSTITMDKDAGKKIINKVIN